MWGAHGGRVANASAPTTEHSPLPFGTSPSLLQAASGPLRFPAVQPWARELLREFSPARAGGPEVTSWSPVPLGSSRVPYTVLPYPGLPVAAEGVGRVPGLALDGMSHGKVLYR